MNEQANKILLDLLQRAANGLDAAVSFSQAQLPDVIHQLLVWNFVHSLIITILALGSIPPVVWLVKKQMRRIPCGVIGEEGYSWEKDKTKYVPTLVWDKKGELNFFVVTLVVAIFFWGAWVLAVLTRLTWLKIGLAPKLYLLEYAADLVK